MDLNLLAEEYLREMETQGSYNEATGKMDYYAKNTLDSHKWTIREFIRWLHGQGKSLPENGDVNEYFRQKQILQFKGQTLHLYLGRLRSFFDWLVDEGHADENPFKNFQFNNNKDRHRRGPRMTQPDPVSLPPKEILDRLIESEIPTLREQLIINLLGNSLRASEIGAIEISAIKSDKTIEYPPWKTKGRRSKPVPLFTRTWDLIQKYIGEERPKDADIDNLIVVKYNGSWRPIDRIRVFKVFKMALKEIFHTPSEYQYRKIHPHMLRHVFAMWYIKKYPGDINGLALVMGWSYKTAIAMVELYTHSHFTKKDVMETWTGER